MRVDFGRTYFSFIEYEYIFGTSKVELHLVQMTIEAFKRSNPPENNRNRGGGGKRGLKNFKSPVVATKLHFFGMQVPQFVKAVIRTFSCELMGTEIRGLALLKDLNDEQSQEGRQMEEEIQIREEFWFSVRNVGEEAGWYYARGVDDSKNYRIDLYIFQQWSSVMKWSPITSLPAWSVFERYQNAGRGSVGDRQMVHHASWGFEESSNG